MLTHSCNPRMQDVPHSLRVTTAPASEPVTLAEAKGHCRVESSFTDDDDEISAMIKTARGLVEKNTERALMPQTLTLWLDSFPQEIELRKCPVASGTVAITYVDSNGDTQTLPTNEYSVDWHGEPGRITPAYGYFWPVTRLQVNAVSVVYSAGYATADLVPSEAKHAIKLLVGHWYKNREAVGEVGAEIELAYCSLVDSIRWGGYL